MTTPVVKRSQVERCQRNWQRLRKSTFLLTVVQILFSIYSFALALGSSQGFFLTPEDPIVDEDPPGYPSNGCLPCSNGIPKNQSDQRSAEVQAAPAATSESLRNLPTQGMAVTNPISVPISLFVGLWLISCQLLPLLLSLFSLFNPLKRFHLLVPALYLQPINLILAILISLLSYHVAFWDQPTGKSTSWQIWLSAAAMILFVTALNLISWWSYLKLYLSVGAFKQSRASKQKPMVPGSRGGLLQCQAITHSPSLDNSSSNGDESSVVLMPEQPSPPPSKYQLYRQRTNSSTNHPATAIRIQ